MGDRRVRWLVVVAAVLAGLRFVIVPWAQAQGEARQQLEVLTQRLDRSVGVVANAKAILAAQETVSKASAAARRPFPEVTDRDDFRLAAQRTLAAISARGGCRVALFDWVLDGDAPDAGLAYGRVNATLEGPLDSLVAVHGQIEGEMPYVAVREVKIELGRGGVAALSDDTVTAAFVLDVYYRPTAPPSPPSPPSTQGGGAP